MTSKNLPIDHLYSFPNREREEIQMALKRYKGKYYVDLRLWFQAQGAEIYSPTKKGLFIEAEHLPKLKEGMHQLGQVYFQLRDHFPAEEKTPVKPHFQSPASRPYRHTQGAKTPMS